MNSIRGCNLRLFITLYNFTPKGENGRNEIRRGDARPFPRPGFLDSLLEVSTETKFAFLSAAL